MLITIQWNMEYGIWNMKYVSLGSSCSVAYQLQKLNKRNIAYPFDWLRCETLDNITNCFGNNFSDFITSCHIVSKSDKFPLSTNDDFPCIDNQSKAISLCMQNKYNMKFYHDFTDGSDMDTIDLKYQRRINRLLDLIKSDNEICFVRDELKPNKLNLDMIDKFQREIKKINPNIKFKMIIILHNPTNKEHELLKLEDKDIIIVNDINPFKDWMRNNLNWLNLFNNFSK